MALDVESKQTLDEVVDRAGAILTALEARLSDVSSQAEGAAGEIENKLIAAVQPVLDELRKANDSIARLVAVAEKVGAGISVQFGGK